MSAQERNRIVPYVFRIRRAVSTPKNHSPDPDSLSKHCGMDVGRQKPNCLNTDAVNLPADALRAFRTGFPVASSASASQEPFWRPEIIVLEPVSALDGPSRRRSGIACHLRAEFDLTYIFIYDLAVVEAFCDRVAVMYFSEVVEIAAANSVFACAHPYTNHCQHCATQGDDIFAGSQGELPDPLNPPQGPFVRVAQIWRHLYEPGRYIQKRLGPMSPATLRWLKEQLPRASKPFVWLRRSSMGCCRGHASG